MAKKKLNAPYDPYHEYYGYEVQEEMERHMYRGAARRHYSEDNLNDGYIKPRDEHFDECAKRDAQRAYYRAGLGPHSGADNQKEDMQYAKEIHVGKKKKKK